MKVSSIRCIIGITVPFIRGIHSYPSSSCFVSSKKRLLESSFFKSSSSLLFLSQQSFYSPSHNNNNNNNNNSDENEEDALKWERMYEAGERMKLPQQESEIWNEEGGGKDRKSSSRGEVKVVTFDLDNTLWRTGEVISAANDALAYYLESCEEVRVIPKRIEVIMNELFQQNRPKYAPKDPDNASYATHLTLLRKDAIAHLLIQYNSFTPFQAHQFANQAFQIWTQARHEAIPLHFANYVLPTLQCIRNNNNNNNNNHPIIIGAITDGNSDPRNVPMLEPYFDFCINSETVGSSKPDKDVYLAAIPQFITHPSLQSIFTNNNHQQLLEEDPDQIIDLIGPWWVHIGDDFLKDIVAAHSLNIRTIWCRELVLEKLMARMNHDNNNNNNNNNNNDNNDNNNKDVSEFMKQVAQNGNQLTMSIGTQDFLTESIHTEFADAIIDQFQDIPSILSQWNNNDDDDEHSNEKQDDTQTMFIDTTTTSGTQVNNEENENTTSMNDETKFCMCCGTSLPSIAQFCSSCGKKQP